MTVKSILCSETSPKQVKALCRSSSQVRKLQVGWFITYYYFHPDKSLTVESFDHRHYYDLRHTTLPHTVKDLLLTINCSSKQKVSGDTDLPGVVILLFFLPHKMA